MRLDKYVSLALDLSRAEVKQLIKQKSIEVNSVVSTDASTEVSQDDVIKYNGEILKYYEKVYLMMNKPSGYISATQDEEATVMDIIPTAYYQKDLKIVGRLDKDTEGLLIITNDGSFIHEITSPKKHIAKTYYVEFSGVLVDNASTLVEQGLQLKNYKTLPSKLEVLDNHSLKLTIYEGKFHQVKEMVLSLGAEVTYLKRLSIGKLSLGDLEVGHVRYLTLDELSLIKEE